MAHTKEKIHHLPIIGPLLSRLEQDVAQAGIQEAMRKIASRTRTKIHVRHDQDDTVTILQKHPVVLVANHPFEAETIALLAALPSREDIFVITNASFINISRNLNKYLIPVYIRHHYKEGTMRLLSGRFLDYVHTSEKLLPDQEHMRNIESIRLASEKVQKGGMIVMYPDRRGVGQQWFPGIGHLMQNIGVKKGVYYIKAHIKGVSGADYLRLFPGIRRFLPPIYVRFSSPKRLVDIVDSKDDAKKITTYLHHDYLQWVQ
ncbi:hypothetical protein HY409_02875 [Candidatus Gottesmanbacteria bacterium]|nr:hypothetical protein [Candidatus Gottesmanbacteria bacterium]